MEKKPYRIATERPIAGRMRKVDEVVNLTAREYAAEIGWGGLEPVEPEKPAKKAAKAAEL
ncbi:hypothetical protein [Ancylobacter sp. G4_0304]|uniref:hypothetical protein n=1 Tax=Ancylobacter sp. G4_0304 TaxID=3114289 RepID=UPI0039C5EC9B